jgi:hypothetical protein
MQRRQNEDSQRSEQEEVGQLSPLSKWITGATGTLLLLLLIRLARRAVRFRHLWRTVSEYLGLQDVEAALDAIERNPLLLTPGAESLISTLLDRAWARGDAARYVSGAVLLSLLAGCRTLGLETVRQTAASSFQARLDAVNGPDGQRALKLLGQLAADKEMAIPEKDVDQDLLEAMGQIMDLLRPLAANAETVSAMDAVLEEMDWIVRRQAGE